MCQMVNKDRVSRQVEMDTVIINITNIKKLYSLPWASYTPLDASVLTGSYSEVEQQVIVYICFMWIR